MLGCRMMMQGGRVPRASPGRRQQLLHGQRAPQPPAPPRRPTCSCCSASGSALCARRLASAAACCRASCACRAASVFASSSCCARSFLAAASSSCGEGRGRGKGRRRCACAVSCRVRSLGAAWHPVAGETWARCQQHQLGCRLQAAGCRQLRQPRPSTPAAAGRQAPAGPSRQFPPPHPTHTPTPTCAMSSTVMPATCTAS
jgi:hypothetical protein